MNELRSGISGHKTRAIFDRYDITSDLNLADAAKKIEDRQRTEFGRPMGTSEENDGLEIAVLKSSRPQ